MSVGLKMSMNDGMGMVGIRFVSVFRQNDSREHHARRDKDADDAPPHGTHEGWIMGAERTHGQAGV